MPVITLIRDGDEPDDTGPVIDPRDGLSIAVETNTTDNTIHHRPPTAWLIAHLEAMLERLESAEE